MVECGWRNVIVEQKATLSLSEGCLQVSGEQEVCIPLHQIQSLIIGSLQVCVTAALIAELAEYGIRTVFCNSKHQPIVGLERMGTHSLATARLQEQIAWSEESKDCLWEHIVRQKIGMQQNILNSIAAGTADCLLPYMERIQPGDPVNCEAQAAKVYFHRLFGYTFTRSQECLQNAALNYGYAILLSNVNCALTARGYNLSLGIHHCNVTNPYNLGCDLMEPLRPCIDKYVFLHPDAVFDAAYRKSLVELLYEAVSYDGKCYELRDAAEVYVEDCLGYMNGKGNRVKEFAFIG